MANIAPYHLATGTLSLLTTGTINRMASLVTLTATTAVPLVLIGTLRADMKLDSNILLNLYHD
jgi:hypothetical protein